VGVLYYDAANLLDIQAKKKAEEEAEAALQAEAAAKRRAEREERKKEKLMQKLAAQEAARLAAEQVTFTGLSYYILCILCIVGDRNILVKYF
jgi:hypothetical protein